MKHPEISKEDERRLAPLFKGEHKDITSFLHRSSEVLSEVLGLPIFLSSVRFDSDYILDIKLVAIDSERILAVLITHFGQIFTETLHTPKKLTPALMKRLESYFKAKLSSAKYEVSLQMSEEESALAERFYAEFMVRYLAFYTNFSDEDIFRTGFSKLLNYPEFNDPLSLSSALSLFENLSKMRLLLSDSSTRAGFSFWMGSELASYGLATSNCSVIAIPYTLNRNPAGAIGLLGPLRIPYKRLFGALTYFSDHLSEVLSKTLYRYKLSFRTPRSAILLDRKWGQNLLEVKHER